MPYQKNSGMADGYKELPSEKEYHEAIENLEQANWSVDCILTHCAPSSIVRTINPSYQTDRLTDF